MDAPGEVILLAWDDTMNDDLQFAPAYVTYEPVYVDVVTGYHKVEAGFVLRPVVHWIPTITTEQTGFDEVKVGSEFGSVEARLFQDGYWKPTAPLNARFREYFIEGVDYFVDDLDWPGKYHPSSGMTLYMPDLVYGVIEVTDPILLNVFDQVINYAGALPSLGPALGEGATLDMVIAVAESTLKPFNPPLFIPGGFGG